MIPNCRYETASNDNSNLQRLSSRIFERHAYLCSSQAPQEMRSKADFSLSGNSASVLRATPEVDLTLHDLFSLMQLSLEFETG